MPDKRACTTIPPVVAGGTFLRRSGNDEACLEKF